LSFNDKKEAVTVTLLTSRFARALAIAGVAAAFASAPVAMADPADLVPVCSGDETPGQDACSTGCPEGAPLNSEGSCSEPGTAQSVGGAIGELPSTDSGADPDVPLGTN
jgi:hypothetical protein